MSKDTVTVTTASCECGHSTFVIGLPIEECRCPECKESVRGELVMRCPSCGTILCCNCMKRIMQKLSGKISTISFDA